MFASPSAPSGGISWNDHKGALLIFDVKSIETGIQTSFGEADAVSVDIDVVDGPGAPAEYADSLVFPKLLQSQLKKNVGQKVLGRLSQGQAKPGQSAPWTLEAASAEDVTKAEQYMRSKATPSLTAPEAPF